MLKIAVIGAETLVGREVVNSLNNKECSVLPLTHNHAFSSDSLDDLVVFAPYPSALENIDVVILAETPTMPEMLSNYNGRILDIRNQSNYSLEPIPLVGSWPKNKIALRIRPVIEQVLAIVPQLIVNIDSLCGTYLQSVAHLGHDGIEGLKEQTIAALNGEEPSIDKLGYRGAFELVPQIPQGHLINVKVPTFYGDMLILHINAANGQALNILQAPCGVEWRDVLPTSKEVAVSPYLLAHCTFLKDNQAAILTLGFDPILWGLLMPILRLLEL